MDIDLLQSLSDSFAPSGNEFAVQQIFREKMTCFGFELSKDFMGNCIAHRKSDGPKLMLIAHSDEVAMMVSHIDEAGFLYVRPVGGMDLSIFPARQVSIYHNDAIVYGVIGRKPIHLAQEEYTTQKTTEEDLWVDIGSRSKSEAQEIVCIGDYACFSSNTQFLQNNCFTGKALDNRAGLFALMNMAEKVCNMNVPYDLYIVSSVQEELGCRGVIPVVNKLKPDYCIVIDATHSIDYPQISPIKYGEITLGKGCVISKGPNIDFRLFSLLQECATQNGIPFQIEVSPSLTRTEAFWTQIANAGIPTAVLSFPCRYMHTPYEIISLSDISSLTILLNTFLMCK